MLVSMLFFREISLLVRNEINFLDQYKKIVIDLQTNRNWIQRERERERGQNLYFSIFFVSIQDLKEN